jgi:hypothetical protein
LFDAGEETKMIKHRLVSPLLLILVIILLSIPACNYSQGGTSFPTPSGTEISFEHFSISNYYYRSETTAQIWVLNSLQQYNRPEGIEWKPNPPNPQLSEPPPEIINFDFFQYFIIMVFNGFRNNYGEHMRINGIWQDKDKVYILARLDEATGTVSPILSSQYSVFQISRNQMTQFGEITFTLIDQNGQERASAIYEVSN